MRFNYLKVNLKTALTVAGAFLLGVGSAVAHAQVNLTAAPTSVSLPDGSSVPMWGYSCGTAVSGSSATCAALSPKTGGWSPVVITVPTGQDLTINLTNNLSFGVGKIPTSLMIVGQLGGGLGNSATSVASPDHSNAQSNVTWPIANNGGGSGTPPVQGPRVQSFSTEVKVGTTTALTWKAPRPGTYLLESGTHPSIQGSMGLYGILVVTAAPSGTTPGTAYPAVSYNAEVPLLFSEIDPVQNRAVDAAVNTAGFTETAVWSGQPGGCGNPASGVGVYQTCYPPVVNYTPLYYLINGVAFDKTNTSGSLFPVSPATGVTGSVLVRLVNAGSRMHVPAIVGSQTGTVASGFSLIAEDGNPLPGLSRIQNEVFMAPGKTYDVMLNVPASGAALPVYDRELSLSGNSIARDSGMLAYIGINSSVPAAGNAAAKAYPDTYNSLIASQTLTVSDPAKGVIANDINVQGVKVQGAAPAGLTLNADGTFTYTGPPTSFTYCGNGTTSGSACALVTLGPAPIELGSGITMGDQAYTSKVATFLKIASPGVLSSDKDAAGYPLTVAASSVTPSSGLTLLVDPKGGFNAIASAPGTYTFTYKAQNSQGTVSSLAATVTLIFPTANGPSIFVVDGQDHTTQIKDYRWIIEEDRTFYVDPSKTTNSGASGSTSELTFGTNFHTSFMPVVATGCTGDLSCESGQKVQGQAVVCDQGNGACRPGTEQTFVTPDKVHLDPTKRYYISVLPGDAATPFETANASGGHGMGGAPLANVSGAWVNPGVTTLSTGQVTVLTQPTPFPPAKLAVFVFEDDFPLNGEVDSGGGVDVLAPNEPGLGGFNITIFDDAGGSGDATGQVDYDMFNQPLSNSLAGSIDPSTGRDACPVSAQATASGLPNGSNGPQKGITGQIVTCPKYEAGVDSTGQKTLSPLAGQAIVANMMPGRYGIVATPAADRIAAGEEWLQTNTLDGQKAHDSFLRIGEAGYFQEYGPAGYHVSIGFANPKIIQARLAGVCNGTDVNITGTNCTNTVTGTVTTERMSRTPDERLYSSGSNKSFSFTQCYVSVGDPDGEDFAFTKCNADGTFSVSGLPDGDWRVTVFDQWNDMLVDGLSTPVALGGGKTTPLGDIATNQWQANFSTRTFLDKNGDGISQDGEDGLALVKTNVRYRDGSFSNRNNTDLNGYAAFNEEFPLFSWYVIETDVSRYKNTGTHVVYDAGGPADGSAACGDGTAFPKCGSSTIADHLANTNETVPVPANLRVPGAVYCDNADCTGFSIATGPEAGGSSGPTANLSTGRIDPPWVLTEGWQGFSGQNNFLEFGKTPYVAGENGGIRGHVVYSSTRPFDDPQFGTQNVWEPLVPNVTINLYQEGTAPDGSQSLTLVDTTKTSSWDDWAQGFRSDGIPNMNCPGQTTADTFFFTLFDQPNWLDVYENGGTATHPKLPGDAQYKCYDGMHNWNQLQPAPYDGMYQFPSVTAMDPVSGKPTGTNCTICAAHPDPDTNDAYRKGLPMLPSGKYVVEVVPPPGYELVKEEDKNILIGDNFIAPVTVQFPGLGSAIYILPDQAEVSSACNATSSSQNPTCSLGRSQPLTSHEGDTPTVDTFWPCVGETRVVPDYISLYPQSLEVAPFAGATRNLCDRKQVTLDDQTSSQAEFFIFTSAHAAAHFTGVITDDFTSEFDPFSPQFGEKFAPPNLPISFKDWTGNEVSRVYTDQWGAYNGLTYSTWEVNPPNPTGYSPTMMVTCMNDPGTGTTPDPLFNPGYSQFCYEIPFMPGQTQYMDTPVTPTSAFSMGYNHPDCAYPDATPAVSEVDGDGIGPWVSAAGKTLTIKALGDQTVINNGYSGPGATIAPYNQKTVIRHYGFGGTQGTVTIGGIAATVTGWSDTQITVTAPKTNGANSVPQCAVQQQAQYGGSTAYCGQLVITAANGKQSIDSVTVTIGGKAPTHVTTTGPMTATGPGDVQKAIDAASPGDLIMLDPGTHNEMLLMWKPVRLQGVGAASSVLNANTQPAGKLDQWRQEVNCLFGLALNGQPYTPASGNNPFATGTGAPSCPATGWAYFTGGPNNPQVDRLPLEGVLGWDTTVNGNLAQLLQEPTLMGAYEGAGITVLSKGVNIPAGSADIFGSGTESAFPTGTTLLTSSNCGSGNSPTGKNANKYSSNFQCNPSGIDGLSITDSSQGGGGIYLHAWAHNMQIANNRIYNNSGTLTGGITVGQGESPDAYLSGTTADSDPGSCQTRTQDGRPTLTNTQLPYCFDLNVNVHNNSISLNSSIGDELYSSTPAGGGGVTFCTGADYYKFNYNWVCGNLSTGDGGGLVHLGYIYHGDIEHNSILFNESTNPTVPTNGGGIIAMGAPPDGLTAAGLECGNTVADADCVPGLSDGTGPGLVINANLIEGNAASSGSGGGLRFQGVNGTDVVNFPKTNAQWNNVSVTNNIINNNIAGWDGAGVSLQDALNVNLINNTIASNDTTASAGVLFNTLGAPLASSQGPTCTVNCGTTSAPQPAGLVAIQHSAVFASTLTTSLNCPTGHPHCGNVSYPLLYNDIFWQNRSFYIGVNGPAADLTNQQNQVALFNAFTGSPAANQPQADASATNGTGAVVTGGTGACVNPASYWDLGVRGDTKPAAETGHIRLAPTYSVVTDAADYPGLNNLASNPTVVSQYCNGSRTPPELGSAGYQVPPGISDATVPNPIFNLTPAATVDEGNNWVNISWGPLAMTNPVTKATLGNYALASSSPAIDHIPTSSSTYNLAPSTDFFGNPRPDTKGTSIDIGAVEFQGPTVPPPTLTSIAPNSGFQGHVVPVTLTGTNLTGASAITVSGAGVTVSGLTVVNATTVTATFTISPTANGTARNVSITTAGGTSGTVTFTVLNPFVTSIAPNSGVRGTTVPVTVTGGGLTGSTGFGGLGTITVQAGTFHVVSDTTVTASLVIPTGAATGVRNISVTTPAGATANTVAFTVTAPLLPTLTSIAPTTGVRGTTVPVTLTGTNLTGATLVTFSGTNVACTGITSTATTVKANCAIAVGAGSGGRTVTVTTPIGTTNTEAFTVLGANLTISAPAPSLVTGTTTTHTGTITVSNTGAASPGPFTFTAAPTVAKVGAAGGTFSIATGGTCVSGHVVNPGASCTIVVQYAPSGTTTATGNVTVTGTGIGTATQTGANFTAN